MLPQPMMDEQQPQMPDSPQEPDGQSRSDSMMPPLEVLAKQIEAYWKKSHRQMYNLYLEEDGPEGLQQAALSQAEEAIQYDQYLRTHGTQPHEAMSSAMREVALNVPY